MNLFSITLSFVIAIIPMWSMSANKHIVERVITDYPFIASPERMAAIRENYRRVEPGMRADEVELILGEPDEIRTLFEPKIKNPEAIGYTYWYVIQRLAANGSENKKQESLVQLTFGFDDRVSTIHTKDLELAANLSSPRNNSQQRESH